MENRKMIGLGTAAMLVTATVLGGCSNSTVPAAPEKAAVKEAPTEISIMTMFYSPEPPTEDNVIVKEVEKRTNTKLKISWVAPANYVEKSNVVMASGDMPDLLLVADPFASNVRTMVKQGAFWDLTPYLKDYKNLLKYPEDTWTNTKMQDGKSYGIPRVRPTEGGSFPAVRKDWLDNLGMKVPATLDEFYAVMKAFTEKDPDGNGKNDTIGYAGVVVPDDLAHFGFVQDILNQTKGYFKASNGKLEYSDLLPGTKEALVYWNKAYKEKLISEDFGILKVNQTQDMAKAGKAGSVFETPQADWLITEELRKTNPKADMLPLVSLNNIAFRDPGFFGMYLIPKKVPEAKMKKILAFMDYGVSDEGSDLGGFGLEGVHYTVKDGAKVPTEQAKKDNVSQQAFGQIYLKYDKYLRAFVNGIPNDMYERNKSIIDQRSKVSIPDPSVGLYSETAIRYLPELKKKSTDLKVKIIYGKEPLSAWDDYVAKLKTDAELAKMMDELNAAYKQRIGK